MGKREKELGAWGEQLAREYLERRDYWIREQNFRCRQGEVDIIAEKEDGLYFVEVKTRTERGKGYGSPAESVTCEKRRRIVKAIRYYVKENGCEGREIHVDVIEIRKEGKRFYVNHLKDVVGG